MRHIGWLGLLLGVGCAADPKPEMHLDDATSWTDSQASPTAPTSDMQAMSLVDPSKWVRADLSDDPLPSHQPKTIVCDPLGTHEADGAFEVDTSYCNYALLSQELEHTLPEGATLEILLSHGPLVWTKPTEGHVALALDGHIVWERTVPIPSDAWLYQDTVTLDRDADAGARWTLHCHNHGANSWRLYDVTWIPEQPTSH